jgi:quercetin dioxygenase-like cupin family protein
MRIVEKPWGHEEIWAETQKYVGKILCIKKGAKLSRQYHDVKDETIRVLSGVLTLETGMYGQNVKKLNPDDTFWVKPGTVHRFCAPDCDVKLIEVSTPELDDVVRLQDDYDRIETLEVDE